jgi:hypothetical protein
MRLSVAHLHGRVAMEVRRDDGTGEGERHARRARDGRRGVLKPENRWRTGVSFLTEPAGRPAGVALLDSGTRDSPSRVGAA